MNIIDRILRKNSETKGGLAILIGITVIVVSLVFSKSYIPQLGFLGSLQYMYIEVVEGKTVSPIVETLPGKPDKDTGIAWPEIKVIKKGYKEDPIRIPTKYILLLGFVFIVFGIYTQISKKADS